MNTSQRQAILDTIEIFKKSNFEEAFKNRYKETANIHNVIVSEYSIAELFALTNRAIERLERFLNEGDWRILPSDNIPVFSYGTITLKNTITTIVNCFNSAMYEQAVPHVKSIVYFEMRSGFWNQPKRIELGIRESSLKTLEERAKRTMAHIDAREDKVQLLIETLDTKTKEIESLIKTKKQELETLKSNQSESNTILANIRNMLLNVTSTRNDIVKLKDDAKNTISHLDNLQTKIEEQVHIADDNIAESQKSLNKFNNEAKTKIDEIASSHKEVSTNAEEVRKMMHFIKDGALIHSFNKRKESIQKAVIAWQVLSIISALLMGGWIFIVFKFLNTSIAEGSAIANSAAIVFANLFINIAKTSPMIVLFWFVLAQYKKERNLLEEYAFREAVAATLTAYLDQLEGETDEHKRDLLVKTVNKLYTQPVITNSETLSISLRSKDIAEIAKSIKDILTREKLN